MCTGEEGGLNSRGSCGGATEEVEQPRRWSNRSNQSDGGQAGGKPQGTRVGGRGGRNIATYLELADDEKHRAFAKGLLQKVRLLVHRKGNVVKESCPTISFANQRGRRSGVGLRPFRTTTFSQDLIPRPHTSIAVPERTSMKESGPSLESPAALLPRGGK